MAEHTAIEWCDSTFNPWIGCTRVSPGCDDCYAARSTPARTLRIEWGPHSPRHLTGDQLWAQPALWEREHEAFMLAHGRRRRVFCASLADVFDRDAPSEWRSRLWQLIADTPHLDWLLLTKRIGNARELLPAFWYADWATDFAHVAIGITAVNQAEAARDIPKLLDLPASRRFVSLEPLLGPVDLTHLDCGEDAAGDIGGWHHCDAVAQWLNALTGEAYSAERHGTTLSGTALSFHVPRLDWVIVGGESGPRARPMHPDWPRQLRDQCARHGVPYLFKQHGEWAELDAGPVHTVHHMDTNAGRAQAQRCDGFINAAGTFVRFMDDAPDDTPYRGLVRAGKKAAGRLLDGRTHDGFPGAAC